MRLHPAVATALVLVGGALLVLPVWEWLNREVQSVVVGAPPVRGMSLVSIVLGVAFILIGVVFSFESRSGSVRSAGGVE